MMTIDQRRALYIRDAQWFRRQALAAYEQGDIHAYNQLMEDYLCHLYYAENVHD